MKRIKQLKVNCPRCGCGLSVVLPKKVCQGDGGYVRVRQCDECGEVYFTTEEADVALERRAGLLAR